MRRHFGGPAFWLLAGCLALALGLRLAGIMWGLPNIFNADEPHLINLAVSFGGGSLKPYAFKYPTLWPYVLFLSYGLYFLAWSGLGLLHGVSEFAGHFAWSPTPFYLIGRLLSTLFCLLGILLAARAERENDAKSPMPWAAFLLAVSPVLVEMSHAAKPDCLMFFLACGGWLFALRVQREGARRDYWACGALLGLAFSSQYTALPALSLIPLAHFLGVGRRPGHYLLEGLAAAAAAFLAGSPFVLLDFPRFRESLRDFAELAALEARDRGTVARAVLRNLGAFAGPGFAGGIAAAAGLWRLLRTQPRLAALVAGPILLQAVVLAAQADGGWPRYLAAVFPGLALLGAAGLRWADRPRPAWTAVLAAVVLGPGLWRSAEMDRFMRLPDTRADAQAWIEARIPTGTPLLIDEAHASPLLAMTREQAEELWRRTREAGSPRSRLYRAMADFHPGGGYRLYRIQRSAKDLYSAPRHVAASQADAPVVDVGAGLSALRPLGVRYVIASSGGATPERSPELWKFFLELYERGELVAVFSPEPGRKAGPVIRVFRLP